MTAKHIFLILLFSALAGCGQSLKIVKSPSDQSEQLDSELIQNDNEDKVEADTTTGSERVNESTPSGTIREEIIAKGTPGSRLKIDFQAAIPWSLLEKYDTAVLLPLSGEYKAVGLNIQQGIIDAYYDNKQRQKIQFYDTNGENINDLYEYAISESSKIVIGPLLKGNIQKIKFNSDRINVPLNAVLNPESSVHPIDISVDYELNQLMDIAYERGYCRILTVTLDTQKGAVTSGEMRKIWEQKGGEILDHISLPMKSINEGSKLLQKSLTTKIDLKVFENGQFIKNEKDDFPFVRQDLDAIIISLPAPQARQIMPMINLLGGEKPVLATSILTSEQFQDQNESDLVDIEFLERPSRFQSAESSRLFQALGYDAFQVSYRLNDQRYFDYEGKTGSFEFDGDTLLMKRLLTLYKVGKNGIEPVPIEEETLF